jgi:hypothetical protein
LALRDRDFAVYWDIGAESFGEDVYGILERFFDFGWCVGDGFG